MGMVKDKQSIGVVSQNSSDEEEEPIKNLKKILQNIYRLPWSQNGVHSVHEDFQKEQCSESLLKDRKANLHEAVSNQFRPESAFNQCRAEDAFINEFKSSTLKSNL